MYPIDRPPELLVKDRYFTMPLPQYEDYDLDEIVSIKGDSEHKVYGDSIYPPPFFPFFIPPLLSPPSQSPSKA